MDWTKIVPWNWFRNEEESERTVSVKYTKNSGGQESPIVQLQSEFDKLFNRLNEGFMKSTVSNSMFENSFFKPLLDVGSDNKSYSIDVELPGMEAENISIELNSRTLKIRGEKRQEKKEDDKGYYRIERSYGAFQRVLDLPEDADEEKISSSYSNGVLKIEIPKKVVPKQEIKLIEIKKV